MRWKDSRKSSNIEDRRGQSPAGASMPSGALLKFVPMLMGSKWGRVVLVLGALYFGYQYLSGGGLPLPSDSLSEPTTPSSATQGSAAPNLPAEGETGDEHRDFVAAVLGSTESVWHKLLPGTYTEPTLVLYSNITTTGCGLGQAQSGPFYCPADQKIYIDLSFMNELKKLGAPGDFAFAYVIAHEVAHHVQNNLGLTSAVQRMQQQRDQVQANQLSVKLELQADCFAGVWGHHVQEQGLLEPGDVNEGIQAAGAVGDDRLQQMSGRAVQPEAFTHGTSEQRIAAFKEGFNSGDPTVCDIGL